MRATLFAGLSAGLILASPAAAQGLAQAVLDELNYVRAHPADYARELASAGPELRGEDPEAVDDAIAFLSAQPALPPLREDPRLCGSARRHVDSQGPTGEVGHGGAGGGLSERLAHEGVHAGLAAENISYGYDAPRDVVRQLVVDSGVAGRGHRANIFGRNYQAAGVDCGPHRAYGAMCVIDFAGALLER